MLLLSDFNKKNNRRSGTFNPKKQRVYLYRPQCRNEELNVWSWMWRDKYLKKSSETFSCVSKKTPPFFSFLHFFFDCCCFRMACVKKFGKKWWTCKFYFFVFMSYNSPYISTWLKTKNIKKRRGVPNRIWNNQLYF